MNRFVLWHLVRNHRIWHDQTPERLVTVCDCMYTWRHEYPRPPLTQLHIIM